MSFFWVSIGFYWFILGFSGFYRVFSWRYWVLLGFIRLLGFHSVPARVTEFYLVSIERRSLFFAGTAFHC